MRRFNESANLAQEDLAIVEGLVVTVVVEVVDEAVVHQEEVVERLEEDEVVGQRAVQRL